MNLLIKRCQVSEVIKWAAAVFVALAAILAVALWAVSQYSDETRWWQAVLFPGVFMAMTVSMIFGQTIRISNEELIVRFFGGQLLRLPIRSITALENGCKFGVKFVSIRYQGYRREKKFSLVFARAETEVGNCSSGSGGRQAGITSSHPSP